MGVSSQGRDPPKTGQVELQAASPGPCMCRFSVLKMTPKAYGQRAPTACPCCELLASRGDQDTQNRGQECCLQPCPSIVDADTGGAADTRPLWDLACTDEPEALGPACQQPPWEPCGNVWRGHVGFLLTGATLLPFAFGVWGPEGSGTLRGGVTPWPRTGSLTQLSGGERSSISHRNTGHCVSEEFRQNNYLLLDKG